MKKLFYIIGMILIVELVVVFIFMNHKSKNDDPCFKEYRANIAESGDQFCSYEIKKNIVCSVVHRGFNGGSIRTIEDADPLTFELMGDYGKDKKNVYYCGKKIEEANSEKFFLLGNSYYMDNKHGFTRGNILNVDLNSFKLIGESNFSKDINNVYNLFGEKTIVKDSDSFEIINYPYAKDKINVYYGDGLDFKIIKNADSPSFEYIEGDYAKDKNHIYYHGMLIEKIDPENLEVLGCGYVKDKENVYHDGVIIKNLNVNNFQEIENSCYFRDNNSLYYFKDKVEKVNGANFKIIGMRGNCGTDKKVFVCNGIIINIMEFIKKVI